MFLTVHASAGIIIGQQTGNIWLAFLAGFISHFLLDMVPHGDQNLIKNRSNITVEEIKLIRKLGIIDTLNTGLLVVIIYLFGLITSPISVLFAVAGAVLPDYINAFYIFFKLKWLKWYSDFHYYTHFIWNGFTINFPQGIAVQSITLAIFITLIVIL